MSLRRLILCFIFPALVLSCNAPAPDAAFHFTLPDASLPADSLLSRAAALRIAARNNGKRQVHADILMGMYYVRKGSYHQARKAVHGGMRRLQEQPDAALMAAAQFVLGKANKNLGELPAALDNYKKSLRYYEQTNDVEAQASIHADLGQLFQLQNDLPQATNHLHTALRLLGKDPQSVTYLTTLHTLANVYGMRNEIDSALQLDEVGLALTTKLDRPEQATSFLDNKANCFVTRKQYDSAERLFHQCLAIDQQLGNKKQLSDTWLNLGLLEQARAQAARAVPYVRKSIALADEAGYRRGQTLGWQTLASLYKEQGQFRHALEASEQYFAYRDSTVDEKREDAIAEWKAIYQTEKKDKEIGEQQALIQKKNLLIAFLAVTLPLCILVLYFASRRNKIRKEKAYREALFEQEQQAATDILWAGEKERRRIAADLHDGVGQVLSAALLNLQALAPAALADEDAKLVDKAAQLVRNGCSEIRQISHNMMPVVLLKNGLVFALQEFIQGFHQKAFSAHLSVDMAGIKLREGKEVMLYRVIQECVNNVVRHARATRLDIAITQEDDQLSIMIEDNGIGIPQTSDVALRGMGMENVRSRVAWMKGTVEWSRVGTAGGTLVAIYVPVV